MKTKNLTSVMFLACTLFLAFSCHKDEDKEQYFQNHKESDNIISSQSDNRGKIRTISYYGEEIDVEQFGDTYMIEGDIAVTQDELDHIHEAKSNGRTKARWPDNIVYFHIESSILNRNLVLEAIAYMTRNTNITFIEKTAVNNKYSKAYISFKTENGCWSSVGRVGRKQTISIGRGCYTLGIIVHEINHALGIWHEQSRKDRDKYIKINWNNIKDGKQHNFMTYASSRRDGSEYSSFDFNSIMLYHPMSFSINGKPTITKKDGSFYTVQRKELSQKDKEGLNKMYKQIYKRVNIQGNNRRYMSSSNGLSPAIVNRTRAYTWEYFRIVKFAGNKVAFKGNNNKYLSVDRNSKQSVVSFSASHVGRTEIFKLEHKKNGKKALRSIYNNKYLSSNNGKNVATCDRSRIGSWELFKINNY